MNKPDFTCENKLFGIIAGVDEVGRGSLSGPVFAVAVIVDKDNIVDVDGIDDSKKLSHTKRVNLYNKIISKFNYALGSSSVDEIDEYNILNATKLAMQRAINKLNIKIALDNVLIDGNQKPDKISIPITSVIRGDSVSISIASASIIAKVSRDRLMDELHETHPVYNWKKNKGYGTKEHMNAIKKYGITKNHRKSFSPIKNLELGNLDYIHNENRVLF